MAGIYIHIPFCRKKCIYCNFYSIVTTKRMEEYVEAVVKEFKSSRVQEFKSYTLTPFFLKAPLVAKVQNSKILRSYGLTVLRSSVLTVYFGGGTPTLLSINLLEKTLNTIYENFEVDSNAEITIEANPEQCSLEYLSALRKIGFNRISIGIQSFNDDVLRFLGRTHSGKDAFVAIENAQKAGFENISVDLIYGISLRSLQDWAQELKTVFKLSIKHLSAYSLTVEENTLLHKKIVQQKSLNLDEEQSLQEMKLLIDEAEKNGFEHYEISNFALQDYHSKHNSNYWNGTPYWGFGASAHSFTGTSRSWNIANVEKYIQAVEANGLFFETEILTPNNQYNEAVLLGLRTKTGIDLKHFEVRFGTEKLNYLLKSLKKIDSRFYEIQSDSLSVTKEGLPLLDFITENLIMI